MQHFLRYVGLSGRTGKQRFLLLLWLVGADVYSAPFQDLVLNIAAPAASRASDLQPDNEGLLRNVTEVAKTRVPRAASETAKTSPPLSSSKETTEPSQLSGSEDGNEAAGWVEVSRAARVHTGPSISSPTVRFYPVGTELQLVGCEEGWFQVLDATTSERGWIYEKYLEAIRSPSHAHAVPQEVQRPTRATLETSALAQPIAKLKKQQLTNAEKQQDYFASTPPGPEACGQLVAVTAAAVFTTMEGLCSRRESPLG